MNTDKKQEPDFLIGVNRRLSAASHVLAFFRNL